MARTPPPPPKQTPVQRLPVDLHQGEPRRADMADEMWKCAEMITFSLVSIVFLLFPAFLVKYNSKWTTTDNLKLGCLPDSCHKLLTHFKKILRFRQIWQRSLYTPVKRTVKAPENLRNHPFLLGHGLVLGASYQQLPSPSPNSINVTKHQKKTRKNRTLPSFPSFIVL